MKHKTLSTPKVKIVFVLITVFFCSCCKPLCYSIISTATKGDFIQSPASKLSLGKNGVPKHRYQYILVYGLTNNYQSSIDNIEKADVWSGSVDYFLNTGKQSSVYNKLETSLSQTPFTNISTHNFYKSTTLDAAHSTYFIQFDYNLLSTGSIQAIVTNFSDLAKYLLIEINNKEGNGGARFNWPYSISQKIVEQSWALLPVPQLASLARFGFIKNDLYSIFLISDKFILENDAISTITNPLDNSGRIKLTSWNGKNYTDFYRDSESGNIKQIASLALDKSKLPTNKIGSVNHIDKDKKQISVTYFNIAGTGDLELSSTISNSGYIGLYQPLQRSNVLSSTIEDDDLKKCCVTVYDCNSQVVLSNDVSSILEPTNICFGGTPIYSNVGVYGIRNFVQASIKLSINGNEEDKPFAVITRQILPSANSHFKLFRLYRGNSIELKFNSRTGANIFLIPDDKIIIK